jgi:hypothetical protein
VLAELKRQGLIRHIGTTGRFYFGLADATDAGSLEIRWLSGERKTTNLLSEVNRIHAVTEGNGITRALCRATECEKNVRKAKAHR